MRRRTFSSWMLGIAVASAIALTGCDSIAAGAKKIADGMSSYTIVLGNVSDGSTYTAVVYDSGEAVGGGLAQAENGAASIRLMPYNGKPAFSERTYQVQVTSGTTVKEAAYVAFVAGGNTHVDWGTMTVISGEPDDEDNGKEMSSYTIVLANVVNGATYTALVYRDNNGKMVPYAVGSRSAAVHGSASMELSGAGGTAITAGTYKVEITELLNRVETVKYEERVPFTPGNIPLDWGTMTVISEGQDKPPSPVKLSGQITVFGAPTDTGYVVSVYDYSAVIEDAAKLEMFTALLSPVATGIGIPGVSGTSTITLEIADTKGADFTFDGAFLVVLKDAGDDSVFVRYMASVPFTAGSATLEYADMDTALVEPSKYAVTFDLNYTNAPNPPEEQAVSEGGKVTQPAAPERTGYTFGGWFTDAAGTGAAWDFGINTVKGTTTLYAKWTRNQYTVTFDTGGISPTPAPLLNVPYENTISTPTETKEGYTLDGWYKEAAKITKWNFGTDTVNGDITLYGAWVLNTYAVTFNTQDGAETEPEKPEAETE